MKFRKIKRFALIYQPIKHTIGVFESKKLAKKYKKKEGLKNYKIQAIDYFICRHDNVKVDLCMGVNIEVCKDCGDVL